MTAKKPQKCDVFTAFAKKVAKWTGKPQVFISAVAIVVIWAVSGPIFGYSDTWQLVINTSTTIITFLMVFLIQSTQNTDTEALHLKLDELIRATDGAHNVLLDLEELGERDLDLIRDEYEKIAAAARVLHQAGKNSIDVPDVDLKIGGGAGI